MSYIGNQPQYTAFLTDTFSGNGTTTIFTMAVAPANTAAVLVAISGVLQAPATYSVIGRILTFSQAPPIGADNISVRYLGLPASNVVTTAYRSISEFTATAGQTTFTPASYTPGFINVFRSGVRLGSENYTATNGVTVVLNNPANEGDLVTFESFFVSSVLNAIPAVSQSVQSAYLADSAVTSSKLNPSVGGRVVKRQIVESTNAVSTTNAAAGYADIPNLTMTYTPLAVGNRLVIRGFFILATALSTNGTNYGGAFGRLVYGPSATTSNPVTHWHRNDGPPVKEMQAGYEVLVDYTTVGTSPFTIKGQYSPNSGQIGTVTSGVNIWGGRSFIEVTEYQGTIL